MKETFFIFDALLYEQIDNVAIGSLVGSAPSNVFLFIMKKMSRENVVLNLNQFTV